MACTTSGRLLSVLTFCTWGLCGAPPPRRPPVTIHDDHPFRKLTLDCGEKKARRNLFGEWSIADLDLEFKVCQILRMQYVSRETPSPQGT
jgi:hypothetical protein